MTCIVGIVHGGHVWIGGDSAGVSDFSIITRKDPKVFRKGDAVIGCSGSFRVAQLLMSSAFVVPKRGTRDVFDWMVTDFVDAVRVAFVSKGHATRVSEEERTETAFLVGLDGRLFCIEGDYQVGEPLTGYESVGCGRDVAYGSLHTSAPYASLTPPAYRVMSALRAATAHNCGVSPPFTILSTAGG